MTLLQSSPRRRPERFGIAQRDGTTDRVWAELVGARSAGTRTDPSVGRTTVPAGGLGERREQLRADRNPVPIGVRALRFPAAPSGAVSGEEVTGRLLQESLMKA